MDTRIEKQIMKINNAENQGKLKEMTKGIGKTQALKYRQKFYRERFMKQLESELITMLYNEDMTKYLE
jgi:hypothetical protein